ncbi:MAG: SoxR reducing system RseC family protein [Pseudomonadales bacterium]|nr:SoxR reducing system RseC family protein [Pseudomonadales bacterium]
MTSNQQESSADELAIERARLVAIDRNSVPDNKAILWVETSQTSSCSQCETQSGCQHSFLGRWFERVEDSLPVICEGDQADLLVVGQWVNIGFPAGLLTKAALLTYVLPPFAMIALAMAFEQWFNSELLTIGGAVMGFLLALATIRLVTAKQFQLQGFQPQFLGLASSSPLS